MFGVSSGLTESGRSPSRMNTRFSRALPGNGSAARDGLNAIATVTTNPIVKLASVFVVIMIVAPMAIPDVSCGKIEQGEEGRQGKGWLDAYVKFKAGRLFPTFLRHYRLPNPRL